MRTYFTAIIFISVSSLFFSCNSDDDEVRNSLSNIEGTVQGTVSCNTEGRGPAYAIVPDNFELSSGFIITATLPEEFKQEGQRIKFDMVASSRYITICTANFSPEQFYEVFNVQILNN